MITRMLSDVEAGLGCLPWISRNAFPDWEDILEDKIVFWLVDWQREPNGLYAVFEIRSLTWDWRRAKIARGCNGLMWRFLLGHSQNFRVLICKLRRKKTMAGGIKASGNVISFLHSIRHRLWYSVMVSSGRVMLWGLGNSGGQRRARFGECSGKYAITQLL